MASGAFAVTRLTLAVPRWFFSSPGGTGIGPGAFADAGHALRERGGARGMERHVAFNLLHHLMDVPVQYRNRTESFQVRQRLRAVRGTPTPVLIHDPQRDVREYHDWRARRKWLDVFFQPFQLGLSK